MAHAVAAGAAALVRQYLEEGFHTCGVKDMARPPLSSSCGCRRFRRESADRSFLREKGVESESPRAEPLGAFGTRRGAESTRPRRW